MNDSEKPVGYNRKHLFYRNVMKRTLDVLLSGFLLLLLSPILILLTVLVRIFHGSPVFFTPTRPGRNEKIFKVYKFRSMTNETDREGKLLPEKQRITKLGKLLRKTSLDEIPELFNIFKGDMSFVGPRPFAMKYLPYYEESERVRHSVRPGLTGLAQISGRNNLPWPQRFEKDLEYISKMSLLQDLSIIFGTVKKLFGDSDVTIPDAGKRYQFDTYRTIETEGTVFEKREGQGLPEIGGEFWTDPAEESFPSNTDGLSWLPAAEDSAFAFSGRAAIALALKDISAVKKVRTALVPSYLSFSMLQPFIQADVRYSFYEIDITDGNAVYRLPENTACDVVFIADYFGMKAPGLEQALEAFRKKGSIIIQDITHSLLDGHAGLSCADYYVASLRKWFPIPSGGWLGKRTGKLTAKPNLEGNTAAEKKLYAMREKAKYIRGELKDKTEYLEKMSVFESDLVQLDPMIRMDDYSFGILKKIDIGQVRLRRRENAEILYDRLKNLKEINFLTAPKQNGNKVPLFVPVCLEKEKRNILREELRKQGYYCPVHWPENMGADRGIRDTELSLVCDQRYDAKDMKALAEAVCRICRERF